MFKKSDVGKNTTLLAFSKLENKQKNSLITECLQEMVLNADLITSSQDRDEYLQGSVKDLLLPMIQEMRISCSAFRKLAAFAISIASSDLAGALLDAQSSGLFDDRTYSKAEFDLLNQGLKLYVPLFEEHLEVNKDVLGASGAEGDMPG